MGYSLHGFCARLKKEAAKKEICGNSRVFVKDWMQCLKEEYDNEFDIWSDIERIYETVVAIYQLLQFDIGEGKVIRLWSFINEYLMASDDDRLKNGEWYDFEASTIISLVLDSFEGCELLEDESEIETEIETSDNEDDNVDPTKTK